MSDVLRHSGGAGDFGQAMALLYTKLRHGWDGRYLLDPSIQSFVAGKARPGTRWADPGGGAGWISVLLAQHGASVWHSDKNPTFVEQARSAVAAAGVAALVDVRVADALSLPYDDAAFDYLISSNVGCAVQRLEPLVCEAARVLKPSGMLFMTAPASLDQLFTTETAEDQVAQQLEAAIAGATSIEALRAVVLEQRQIHRATLEWINGRARLLRKRQAPDGAEIFRIISGPMLVPNFWHGEDDYLRAIAKAGLLCSDENVTAKRLTRAERRDINRGKPSEETLGERYETHPAFRIFLAQKPTGA